MNNLHVLGKTDRIFSLFCENMRIANAFPVFQQKVNLFLSDERAYEKLAVQTAPFIILRGDGTCGGVLQEFADDLADGLVCNGQAVVEIDDNVEQYDKLQNMVCKGIVGFQNRALEIDFFRKIHGPKFQFWFDNPLRFEKVLRNLPEEYYILCQDANYASLIRDYYHTKNAIQFPPGGKMLQRISCDQEERPYDIVFVGTYFEDSGNTLEGFQREFYDYMLSHPSETFEEGLSGLLKRKSAEGQRIREEDGESDKERFIELSRSLKPACRAVIGYYRNAVISTILEAGFELHVYGDSWNDYEGAGREHLKIHPHATVEESLKELGKSKIGLNIMSWHKAGMTERVANIMLSGAVCLTEETVYLRENMQIGEEIITFGLDRLEELPDKIQTLLENPDLRERIAGNAYRDAMDKYTWPRRAEELIMLSERAAKDTITVF
ncbi:MAG: glycosyltransferase, partial [Acetatifactor sp.]|nr:glycosyltransferase [Acetatifactor sp.]